MSGMKLGKICSYKNKQYLFFGSNIALLAFGVASLIVGVWLYVSRNDFIELTPSSYSALSAAGLCAFTGATVCFISLIGFIAVSWRNRYLIYSYVGFVALLIIIHSITRVTGFVYREESRENLRQSLLRNINTTRIITRIGKEIHLQVTWDHLQSELQCCGVDSYKDWYYSTQWPKNEFVPDSCCIPEQFNGNSSTEHCGKLPTESDIFYQEGCYEKFSEWLSHHVILVNWMASFLLVVEIVVLVSVVLVFVEFKKPVRSRHRGSSRRQQVDETLEELQLNPMDRIGDASEEPTFHMPSNLTPMDSR